MTTCKSIWRHQDGAVPNTLAFGYAFFAQAMGIYLMATGNAWLWLPALLLTAHSLVIAGYLIHDLAHLTVFREKKLNLGAGEVMSWICGAAYAPFSRIHYMHMRHHGDRADLALFDARAFIQRGPVWLRKLIYLLEWAHIPAVELLMHYHILVRPFYNPAFANERARVILVGLTRAVFFVGLYLLSPWVLLGYAIAYLLFITALFWGDAWAHTYEHFLIERADQAVPREGRDAEWDRQHTFSNLISTRWPWLNLLNLNFGYHTAHHDRPATPWYKLPEQHYATYGEQASNVLPYRELWTTFRRNRLRKISAEDIGHLQDPPGRADHFLGAHGVSFLSIV